MMRTAIVVRIAVGLAAVTLSACVPAKSPLVDGVEQLPEDERIFQGALALYDAAPPDFEGAKAGFDDLVVRFPESDRHDNASYLAGRCAYELGRFAEARDALLAMRTAHPTSPFVPSAAYFTGRSRFEMNDFVASVDDFVAASADPLATYADNAAYYAGRAYYEAGLLPEAAIALASFESTWPDSSYLDNGRYHLSRAHFDQRSYAAAKPPLTRLLAETPNSIYADNAQYYLARSEYGLGRFVEALAAFDAVVRDHPLSQYVDNALYYEVRSHADLSSAGAVAGECAAASAVLDELATRFPTSPELPRAQRYLQNSGC